MWRRPCWRDRTPLSPPAARFRGRARSATRAVSTAGPPPSTTATARPPSRCCSGPRSQLPAPPHLHQRGPVHAHRHRQRRRRRRRQRHRHRHRRGGSDLHAHGRGGRERGGQVTGPGIACPGDCTQSYMVDTEVVLRAAADPGSAFTGWGGDCAGAGECSVTMSSDRSVTATFAMPQNTAPLVEAGGDGTVAEGSLLWWAGSFTDPDADSWSATVDYGDGAGAVPLSLAADKSFQLSHSYLDNGSYTVTVSVDDGHTSGSDSFQVTVSNVAPSVLAGRTPLSPPADAFAAGLVQRPGSLGQVDRHRRLRRRLGHPAAPASGPRSQLPAPPHSTQRGPVHPHRHPSATTTAAQAATPSPSPSRHHCRPPIYRSRTRTTHPALVGGTLVYTLTESERRPHRGGRSHGDGHAAGRCRLRFGDVDPWRCSQSSGVVTCTFASLPSG